MGQSLHTSQGCSDLTKAAGGLLGLLWLVAGAVGCAVPPEPLDCTEASSTSEGTAGLSMSSSPTVPSSTSDLGETEASSDSTAGGEVPCDPGLVRCGDDCIDPMTNPTYCGASSPCDANPGTACTAGGARCVDGQCRFCTLVADFEEPEDVAGWMTGSWIRDGDVGWGIYDISAPSLWGEVDFEGLVYGTDGNRGPPYPSSYAESSWATTSSIDFGGELSFRSWHVDEGGANEMGLDNKRIEIDVGGGYQTLVDCFGGIRADLPFCSVAGLKGPRGRDDWDIVVLDTSPYAGMTGTLRFQYDTVTSEQLFEQGWYFDDLRVGECAR